MLFDIQIIFEIPWEIPEQWENNFNQKSLAKHTDFLSFKEMEKFSKK